MANQGALKTNWSNKSFTVQMRQERHVMNMSTLFQSCQYYIRMT